MFLCVFVVPMFPSSLAGDMQSGARSYLVGCCVLDQLLHMPSE